MKSNSSQTRKQGGGLVFDWSDLAFGSKKPIRTLQATFIAAPRELSERRFAQLVKEHLPSSNIVLGLAKEEYILGFEGQPQFRTLQAATLQKLINRINNASSKHKIYILHYSQRETNYLLEKLGFSRVIFVNGSWKYTFHTLDIFYTLVKQGLKPLLISPFADESEAKRYDKRIKSEIKRSLPELSTYQSGWGRHSEEELLELANVAAKQSFDYNFQTGAVLGRRYQGYRARYRFLATSFNAVVPYQTYAMHHGASRETNFSPPHDLNHYDTCHAEVEMVIKAQREGIDLKGTTLFINLMPCPPCARMIAETPIKEIVYRFDHSEGYAVSFLTGAGKKVRRFAGQSEEQV